MKTFIMLVALLFTTVVHGAEPVKTIQIADIGGAEAQVCYGLGWESLARRYWTNDTGRTLRVYATTFSMGMDFGGTADFHVMTFKTPSMEPLVPIIMWDHYTFTDTISTFKVPVAGGNYVELLPGEGVETWVHCAPFPGTNKARSAYQLWNIFVLVSLEVNAR